jgi:hypothetical protein
VTVGRSTFNDLKTVKAPSTGKGKVASTEEKTEGEGKFKVSGLKFNNWRIKFPS